MQGKWKDPSMQSLTRLLWSGSSLKKKEVQPGPNIDHTFMKVYGVKFIESVKECQEQLLLQQPLLPGCWSPAQCPGNLIGTAIYELPPLTLAI